MIRQIGRGRGLEILFRRIYLCDHAFDRMGDEVYFALDRIVLVY